MTTETIADGLERASFRTAFLTASTWAQCTASEPELAYAMANWEPGQTVEDAIARLKSRRQLERRGILQREARAAKAAAESGDD